MFFCILFFNTVVTDAADTEFLPTQYRSSKVLNSIHDQYIKQKCLELADRENECYKTLPKTATEEDWGEARGGDKGGKNIALCTLIIDVQNKDNNESTDWCEINIPARYNEYRTEKSKLYKQPYIFMSSEEASLFEPFENMVSLKKHYPLYEYQKDAKDFYNSKTPFCNKWATHYCANNEGSGCKHHYDDTEQQILRYLRFLLERKDVQKTEEIFSPLRDLIDRCSTFMNDIKFVCSILLHTKMSPCFFCFTNLNDFFSNDFPELMQKVLSQILKQL